MKPQWLWLENTWVDLELLQKNNPTQKGLQKHDESRV